MLGPSLMHVLVILAKLLAFLLFRAFLSSPRIRICFDAVWQYYSNFAAICVGDGGHRVGWNTGWGLAGIRAEDYGLNVSIKARFQGQCCGVKSRTLSHQILELIRSSVSTLCEYLASDTRSAIIGTWRIRDWSLPAKFSLRTAEDVLKNLPGCVVYCLLTETFISWLG